MLFDTHAHYNLSPLYDNWQNYVQKAKQAGITHTNVVGTDLDTCQKALILKKAQGNFFTLSLGLHPLCTYKQQQLLTDKSLNLLIKQFTKLLENHLPLISAIGEIGLDFFRLDKSQTLFTQIKNAQIILCQKQLALATKYHLPVVLHVRDDECNLHDNNNAYALIHQLLAENSFTQTTIWHCFSGQENYLQKILAKKNAYISFAGNLTFKNAPALRELFKLVPTAKLLLETDAPFLSPEPRRGQICQPAFLAHTGRLAASLGADLEQIYQNSYSLFTKTEI